MDTSDLFYIIQILFAIFPELSVKYSLAACCSNLTDGFIQYAGIGFINNKDVFLVMMA